jgi:hypothetical protein
MAFFLVIVALAGLWYWQLRGQHHRIQVLASVLSQFQVEKLMETVADGYLRALGEADADRRSQVWNMLDQAETLLDSQLQSFVAAFDSTPATEARFSTLPVNLPFALQVFASASADLRELLHVHAQGFALVRVNAAQRSQKERAFMLTAELLLLQHSCQWFCRSKATANARMLARHRTPQAQLLSSVSEQTRQAYLQLLS